MTHRLDQLRSLLDDRGLNAILVSNPANRFYFSGYTSEDAAADESAGMLLISPSEALLYTSANNVAWAASEAAGFDAHAWQRPWPEFIAKEINERGWPSVGFEDAALTVSFYNDVTAKLDGTGQLVAIGDAVDRLRSVKDDTEHAALAAALHLTDEAFVQTVEQLRPGMTEREGAWLTERLMRELGADAVAFPTIVASGPHAARPHHTPSDRPLQTGEPVIIDMGAKLAGYNGDLTRTIWLGEPDRKLLDVYGAVWRAQQVVLAALRAGASGKDVDAAARQAIHDGGYGDYIVHGVGHGLGIRVHERPSAGEHSDDILQAGEVITVEPGIYIPDWGGVRIEDVGIVRDGGFEVLTGAPKYVPADGQEERAL